MNRLKRLAARIPLITALIFVSVNSAFPPPVLAQENPGKISFQPSVIPQGTMVYEEYTFRFQYKSFFIRVAPFVIYHGEYYSLKQIIPWIKNNYPQVNYSWLLKKLRTSIHYGFNLTQLPQEVADGVDYVGFRLVDLNFPLSWFELELVEGPEYNITLIHIPKAHLTFSFEDLYPYGYTVTHVNRTYILIGGVKGQRDLYLDPITYSIPVITIIGGSEGSELKSQNVYDEAIAQGWNINATNSMDKQFSFNATYCLGNGTVEGTTWFADENIDLLLWGPFPRYTKYLEVKNYAHLRFGKVTDSNAKTTEKGVHYIVNNAGGGGLPYQIYGNSGNEIELYSSIFTGGSYVSSGGDATAWNCEFRQMLSGSGWDIYRTNIGLQTYLLHGATGTFDDILVYSASYGWYVRWGVGDVTFTNLKTKNCTETVCLRDTAIQLYLINPDVDIWKLNFIDSPNGKVIRQYTYDLFLFYENGSIVEDASVTISHYGQGGGEAYSGSTGANGSIPSQIFSMGFYNQSGGNSLYDLNPYHLSIVKGDYTYGGNFTLSKKENMTVILQEPEETPSMGPFYHSYTIDYGAALMIRAPDRVEPNLPQYLADTVPISVDIQLLNRMSRTRNLGLLYNVTGPEGELILGGSLEEDLDPNSQEELTLFWKAPLGKKEAPKNYTLSLQVISRGRELGDPISYSITVAQSSWAPLYVLGLLGIVAVISTVCYGGYRLVRREE